MSNEPTGAELAKGFTCRTKGCGRKHIFDLYVYAHWDMQLRHACTCGALSTIQRGHVTVSKPGKVRVTNPAALNGSPGHST